MDREDERLDSLADIDSSIACRNFGDFFFLLWSRISFFNFLFPISATLLSLDYFPVLPLLLLFRCWNNKKRLDLHRYDNQEHERCTAGLLRADIFGMHSAPLYSALCVFSSPQRRGIWAAPLMTAFVAGSETKTETYTGRQRPIRQVIEGKGPPVCLIFVNMRDAASPTHTYANAPPLPLAPATSERLRVVLLNRG